MKTKFTTNNDSSGVLLKPKPDITEYLGALKSSAKFGPQVVHHKIINEAQPKFADQFPNLAPQLQELLKKEGINNLYNHQRQAIDCILNKVDLLVATPTASGKSLIYNLPVLNELYNNDNSHSLYLFPLKALAQDQRNVLENLAAQLPPDTAPGIKNLSALFDGDTNGYQRRKIKDFPPRVLMTNPEMLHLSMLPYHEGWRQFFSKLRYVVIDEVHTYRGVFGSHMSWVLRRLQRIAEHYGGKPQYIMLSATVGNPRELGQALINKPVEVISFSGAPTAEKHMVFFNPWDSAANAACQLLEAAIKRKLRTIVYTQSRKMTELINMWTGPRLGNLSDKLSAYRAGFLPQERREIEAQLFSGELLGVISTSALELGIDIGDLDLCILVGYPGSVMATWQRGGRVGRSMRKSAIIMIGQEDALDQHFMREPEDFFRRVPESAVLNPENEAIVNQHLICCGAELPIQEYDQLFADKTIQKQIKNLTQAGSLLETLSGGTWMSSRKYPQRNVTLRGGGQQMSIIDSERGEIVGEIDNVRGMKECHPGAVYLHRNRTWIVEELDLLENEVLVSQAKPKYFTRPVIDKQTEILEIVDSTSSFGVDVFFGRLKVRERVTGYQKRNSLTHKLISTLPLDLPEQVIETEGVWVDIPETTVETVQSKKYHFMGAIHAMEHGMIALFPLLVLCDRNDIGGISCPLHEQTESASIFIYDGYAGGIGLAHEAFNKIDTLLQQTFSTISNCQCETGCPSCVHSPKCGSGNRPIDKAACVFLLGEILHSKPTAFSASGRARVENKDTIKVAVSAKAKDIPRGLEVLPEKFCVFDLETIRSAEEVGGWGKIERMGMSVGVIYDSVADDFITYVEGEEHQLIDHLFTFDLVVGFNNRRFDNRVLSAFTKKNININQLPTLDLLEEVKNYLGYRVSLNGLAEHTLGKKKSADGLQALEWYKQGRIDLISKYCKQDVEITKKLFYHGLEEGFLIFANKAGQKVRLPLVLDSAIYKVLSTEQ